MKSALLLAVVLLRVELGLIYTPPKPSEDRSDLKGSAGSKLFKLGYPALAKRFNDDFLGGKTIS